MSGLPQSWANCLIGEVTQIIAGGTPPSKEPMNFQEKGGVPWITPADLSGYRHMYISHGARNLSEIGYKASSAKKMPAGTVLFSSRAPIGYVAIAKHEISTNQGFKNFVLPSSLESRYVYYYLRHITAFAESVATGTTFKELSGAAAAKLPFLLAPLNEQKRIADKLDTLLAAVDSCRARLDKVPSLINRFRQSVLAAATSGSLTEDWRVIHAVTLLDWSDTTIGEISFVTKLAGFEYTDYVKYREGGDLNVLKAENVGKLGFRRTIYSTVFSEEVATLTRSKVSAGDLLMVFVGAGTGQVATVPEGKNWFLGPNIALIRPDQKKVNSKYLEYYFRSPIGLPEIAKFIKSTAQPSLSMTTIRQIRFNSPQQDEQAEIVRRVDALFSIADKLETSLATARKRVGQLTPAILAQAFRGELVAQDPNDEPASALLARITDATAPKPKRTIKKAA